MAMLNKSRNPLPDDRDRFSSRNPYYLGEIDGIRLRRERLARIASAILIGSIIAAGAIFAAAFPMRASADQAAQVQSCKVWRDC